METPKVISWKNMPTRLPIWTSATAYLLLEHFNASQVIWGVVGTIFGLGWIVAVIQLFREEKVELFKPTN